MRLAFIGDPHQDKYGESPTSGGLPPRQVDYMETLSRVVNGVISNQCQYALFLGDIFNRRHPNPTIIHHVRKCIQKLQTADISVIAIPGNHDMRRSASEKDPLDLLPSQTKVIRRPEVLQFPEFQLAAIPYPNKHTLMQRDEYRNLSPTEILRKLSELTVSALLHLESQLEPDKPSVLIGHMALDMATSGSETDYMYGRDIYIPLAHIPDAFDYVVMGHIHKPQEIARPSGADEWVAPELDPSHYVWYPGSLEQSNFGEEGQHKTWLLLDLEEQSMTRLGTGHRCHNTLRLDLTGEGRSDLLLCNEGDIVKLIVRHRKGQVIDNQEYFKALEHAFSVDIEREIVKEERNTRLSLSADRAETHEDLLRAFGEQQNWTPERIEALIVNGAERIQGYLTA